MPRTDAQPLAFRVVPSAAGFAAFVASPRGLKRVFLPEPTRAHVLDAVQRSEPGATEVPTLLPKLADCLTRFFAGEPVAFDVDCDWAGRTAFEQAVWRACRRVPYGKTATYGDLAKRIGNPQAARAIGMAMSRNPCPIVVPCHRIVGSNGLGGFSGSGGLDQKRDLLEMEAGSADSLFR